MDIVRLVHLRRSLLLDLAVVLANLGGVLTGLSVPTLFVGALREGPAITRYKPEP